MKLGLMKMKTLKKFNNEIIEVKCMEEFIELVSKPIVIETNTLGTLELRQIFDDDLNYLLKNINGGYSSI